MKSLQADLANRISDLLGSEFKRTKLVWRRFTAETVQVVSLQRSKWGKQYYLNFGILLRELKELKLPHPVDCHIIARLSMIVGGDPKIFVIDFESTDPTENIAVVLRSLEQAKASFLEKCKTLSGTRRYIRKNRAVLITGEAKEALF